MPLSANSFAYTLVAVKPGIVLSSLTTTSPSGRTKKSTRAMPSQSVATNDATASCWTRSVVAAGSRAGTISSMPPSAYFASKSYQSAFATISPTIDAIGSRFPSTPTSTSTPGWNSSTSTLSSWRRASATAASSSAAVRAFEIPTDDPSRAGFTNTG